MKTKFLLVIAWAFLSASLVSCRQEVNELLPGGKEGAAVNFFSAFDVTYTYAGKYGASGSIPATNVYMDTLYDNKELQGSEVFVHLSYANSVDRSYPVNTNNSSVSYVRYESGQHTFYFTDIEGNLAEKLSLNLKPESFNCIYFTDGTAAEDTVVYETLVVEEDRESVAGKTGVRFVDLSSDAGKFSIYLHKSDGSETEAVPGGLAYLTASDPQFFDSEEANGNGQLDFRLRSADNTAASLTVGVPFMAGTRYTIVIEGFLNAQKRTVEGHSFTVQGALRTEMRRIY